MLILSRKPGDAIVIGDGIRIVVLESDRRGVRLGIEAPSDVSILREEIVHAIANENRRANATSDASGWLDVVKVKQKGSG
jgi:carbon storage regulator